MSSIAEPWRRLTGRNKVVEFVDMCLRGAAQVMLQNNPLTGLLILIAIGVGAGLAGAPRLVGGAIVGVAVGTVTALLLRADADSVRQGLFGFSPLLTGIGVLLFLRGGALLWLLVVFGAAATTITTLALTPVTRTWGLLPFTFPFVLTTWAVLMGAYQFAAVTVATPGRPALPGTTHVAPASPVADVVPGMIEGIAQVYLIPSAVAGAIIVLALAVNSLRAALFAIIGTVVATLVAIWYEAGASAVDAGLWDFNAVLTAIALGAVSYRPTLAAILYTLFGIIATVFVQAALTTVLEPLAIPTLTAPFVITTWLFLLGKRHFGPDRPAPAAAR
ncbi:urea transporter [Micromonospora eburnea]|uniref:Urea transporter n=1 Tax=Micromonospora eburnea TaxID=227316 RepID=A0A1C6UF87_9ACTN|nr:urea transporter [Micromonospora eburnea]SCL52642.1 urea transporter [Micromonospora eburnea]